MLSVFTEDSQYYAGFQTRPGLCTTPWVIVDCCGATERANPIVFSIFRHSAPDKGMFYSLVSLLTFLFRQDDLHLLLSGNTNPQRSQFLAHIIIKESFLYR